MWVDGNAPVKKTVNDFMRRAVFADCHNRPGSTFENHSRQTRGIAGALGTDQATGNPLSRKPSCKSVPGTLTTPASRGRVQDNRKLVTPRHNTPLSADGATNADPWPVHRTSSDDLRRGRAWTGLSVTFDVRVLFPTGPVVPHRVPSSAGRTATTAPCYSPDKRYN
ncbi:MAG: hypothetical protein NVS2B16_24480 [Chloroflexota bacterium]